MKNAHKKLLLQERLELSTSAYLSRDILGESTDYKYGELTDCATGDASLNEEVMYHKKKNSLLFSQFL